MTFDSDLKALSEEYDRIEPNIRFRMARSISRSRFGPDLLFERSNERQHSHQDRNFAKELGIKPKLSDRQAFNKAFNKVKEYYIKKGYFESQLQYAFIRR